MGKSLDSRLVLFRIRSGTVLVAIRDLSLSLIVCDGSPFDS